MANKRKLRVKGRFKTEIFANSKATGSFFLGYTGTAHFAGCDGDGIRFHCLCEKNLAQMDSLPCIFFLFREISLN